MSSRLPYHKNAQAHLDTRRFSTLFILVCDSSRSAWGTLKTLAEHWPYVGYMPGDAGEFPAPTPLALPSGDRECLLIDMGERLKRAQCIEIARAAVRSGTRLTCVSQRSGYWRIGKRAGE